MAVPNKFVQFMLAKQNVHNVPLISNENTCFQEMFKRMLCGEGTFPSFTANAQPYAPVPGLVLLSSVAAHDFIVGQVIEVTKGTVSEKFYIRDVPSQFEVLVESESLTGEVTLRLCRGGWTYNQVAPMVCDFYPRDYVAGEDVVLRLDGTLCPNSTDTTGRWEVASLHLEIDGVLTPITATPVAMYTRGRPNLTRPTPNLWGTTGNCWSVFFDHNTVYFMTTINSFGRTVYYDDPVNPWSSGYSPYRSHAHANSSSSNASMSGPTYHYAFGKINSVEPFDLPTEACKAFLQFPSIFAADATDTTDTSSTSMTYIRQAGFYPVPGGSSPVYMPLLPPQHSAYTTVSISKVATSSTAYKVPFWGGSIGLGKQQARVSTEDSEASISFGTLKGVVNLLTPMNTMASGIFTGLYKTPNSDSPMAFPIEKYTDGTVLVGVSTGSPLEDANSHYNVVRTEYFGVIVGGVW